MDIALNFLWLGNWGHHALAWQPREDLNYGSLVSAGVSIEVDPVKGHQPMIVDIWPGNLRCGDLEILLEKLEKDWPSGVALDSEVILNSIGTRKAV